MGALRADMLHFWVEFLKYHPIVVLSGNTLGPVTFPEMQPTTESLAMAYPEGQAEGLEAGEAAEVPDLEVLHAGSHNSVEILVQGHVLHWG